MKLGLKYRIALVIFALEATMLSALLWLTHANTLSSTQEQLTKTHDVVFGLLEELSTAALLTEEYGDLQFFFSDVTRDPAVTMIVLTDLANQVVASNNLRLVGQAPPPFDSRAERIWRSKTVSTSAGPIGMLGIEFSTKPLTEAVNRSRDLGISVAAVGMSTTLLVGLVAGFVLTRRLEKITLAAKKIAEGDETAKCNVGGKDEIGALGETFDRMVKNIAESRQILALQMKRNEVILATTRDGFCLMQPDGQLREVNQSYCDMLEYGRASLIEKNITQLCALEHQSIFRKRLAETVAEGFSHFETVQRSRHGKMLNLDVSLSTLQTETGPLIFGFLRDISDRKRDELELLRHSNELERRVEERTAQLKKQAQIIEKTHDAVITTDLKNVIQSWNKGAELLYGYQADEAINRSVELIFSSSIDELPIGSVIAESGYSDKLERELKLRKKNGQEFYALVSLSVTRDENDKPTGFIYFSIDVTERRNFELLLQRRGIELETLNKELESFSYSVSHDLRAPLRSIDGFSQALLDEYSTNLDDTGRDYLSRIRRSAQRMGQLIDDILQLSRVSRSELTLEHVNLSVLASEITAELRERNSQRQADITIAPNLAAYCDKKLVRILMENLLSNAWKYTSKKPRAVIEIGSRLVDGETVYYIKDNGAGFEIKYAHRLFSAFQRLHRPDEFEGTGIGLATVQRIVKRHGGKIWAEAEPDKGATFYFYL